MTLNVYILHSEPFYRRNPPKPVKTSNLLVLNKRGAMRQRDINGSMD